MALGNRPSLGSLESGIQTPESLRVPKEYKTNPAQSEAVQSGNKEQEGSQKEALALLFIAEGESEPDFYAKNCIEQLINAGLDPDFIENLTTHSDIQLAISEARDMDIDEPVELNQQLIFNLKKEQEDQIQAKANETEDEGVQIIAQVSKSKEQSSQKIRQERKNQKENQKEDSALSKIQENFAKAPNKKNYITEQIKTLKEEFAKQLETSTDLQDTLAVMEQFRDAMDLPDSPDVSDNDRLVVNQIFESSVTSLDATGIRSFCQAIQEDTTLSAPAKKHVLQKLGVEKTIYTGQDAQKALDTKAINPKTGEPEYVYTPETPLQMQGDAELYVNKNGEQVIKIDGRTELPLRGVNGPEGDGVRQRIRFAMIQNILDGALNGQSQLLLGGAANSHESNAYESTMKKADHLLMAMLPAGSATGLTGRIPSEQDLMYLKKYMNVITENKSMGRVQLQNNLVEIGIIDGPGAIDINRANQIGDILANEDYFDSMANTRMNDDAYSTMLSRLEIEDGIDALPDEVGEK